MPPSNVLSAGHLLPTLLILGLAAPVLEAFPVDAASSRQASGLGAMLASASTPVRPQQTQAQRLAAQRARELREASEPRFRLDHIGSIVPELRAEAGIIYNPVTHEVLWEENAQVKRSIASITKVMTALVVLEGDPDLDVRETVAAADVRAASITFLQAGEQVRREDLLHLLLIASDNGAARTLARVSPQGTTGFIARMNEKAGELGLERTEFADSSGLNADNQSSAYDISRLIVYAAGDQRIAEIMRKPNYSFRTSRRPVNVRNTNRLLGEVDVQAGKTGFIRRAGYCLATLLRLPQGDEVVVVVLGARTNAARFWETRHLFDWLRSHTQEFFYPRPQPDF